jgi:beta-N-acetylhexosaminidase
MSLEEKVGQLVISGLDGTAMDDHALGLIRDGHIGGFILFKDNILNADQARKLTDTLKETNRSFGGIPLFLGVDEEGGRVSRMPDDYVDLPTNQVIGQADKPEFSREIGQILAREVGSLGLNLDFAPVLDVNSNPQNPVIGDRSFGADAERVASLGVATMRGIQAGGIVTAVKHFPGHGDTSVDSHIGLPVVRHPLSRLRRLELIPFTEAVRNQADIVMVAHILLPQIDADAPSSLSPKIITDLLREEMGYDGVVITDDLTMGAIAGRYDPGEAAVKAVNAGSDLVLVCHDYEKEKAVLDALLDAARTGKISQAAIDRSVYRILRLKAKYGLADTPAKAVSTAALNSDIRQLLDRYMGNGQK